MLTKRKICFLNHLLWVEREKTVFEQKNRRRNNNKFTYVCIRIADKHLENSTRIFSVCINISSVCTTHWLCQFTLHTEFKWHERVHGLRWPVLWIVFHSLNAFSSSSSSFEHQKIEYGAQRVCAICATWLCWCFGVYLLEWIEYLTYTPLEHRVTIILFQRIYRIPIRRMCFFCFVFACSSHHSCFLLLVQYEIANLFPCFNLGVICYLAWWTDCAAYTRLVRNMESNMRVLRMYKYIWESVCWFAAK